MKHWRPLYPAALALLVGSSACSEGDDQGGDESPARETLGAPDVEGCKQPSPGPAPMRRLSNYEYANTMTDLLGTTTLGSAETGDDNEAAQIVENIVSRFPREPVSLGFRNNAGALTITPLLAEGFGSAAATFAELLIERGDAVPCDVDEVNGPCAQTFVEDFGLRTYRRPLSNSELQRYSSLYERAIVETGSFRSALEWIATAMFSSSHFLYRVELSGVDSVERPDGFEMASRLSYLLWQTMPDDELFRAAAEGELETEAGISDQLRRMLAHDKALRVYEFFEQWLDLDELADAHRDETVYPEADDQLSALLLAENRAFIYDVLTEGRDFEDLMAGEYTFANRRLATHYDLDDPPAGDSFERLAAPGRAGVLTQATLLVHDHPTRTSIVKRGLKIRTDFLCQLVPAPPDDVDLTLPILDDDLSQAERLKAHSSNPSCAGCHQLMDPIGELFEGFDALGRPQPSVPTEGLELVAAGSLSGTYQSPQQLAAAMSTSEEVRECFVRQAFRFFYGRDVTASDSCNEAQLMSRFAENDYRVVDLLVGLTQTDQFRYRDGRAE